MVVRHRSTVVRHYSTVVRRRSTVVRRRSTVVRHRLINRLMAMYSSSTAMGHIAYFSSIHGRGFLGK